MREEDHLGSGAPKEYEPWLFPKTNNASLKSTSGNAWRSELNIMNKTNRNFGDKKIYCI